MKKHFYNILADKKISVIVPVFNEGLDLVPNLQLLIAEVEPYFSTFEIIVVSDGSTDSTNALLQRISHPNLVTIIIHENMGKGFAVREGFKSAQGDYLLFIDGGMELHPKEIRIFLGLMDLYEADIVIGSKRHPQSQVRYPLSRRILSRAFQAIVQLLFSLRVTDSQVGLKLFKREVISAILPELRIDRYGFDLEMLVLARQKGFKNMLEAPVQLEYFNMHRKNLFKELSHVIHISLVIFMDTLKLYSRFSAAKRNSKIHR